MEVKNVSVMIGVPSTGGWKARFGVCLAMLCAQLTQQRVSFAINSKESSLLPRARQELVDDARKLGFDYLLFLDDDMIFPASVFDDLVAHGKTIAAANCVVRSAQQPRFTASRDGQFLNSARLTGISQADKVGSAVMLLDLRNFGSDTGGLFEVPWDEAKKAYHGEDYTFCRKMREQGVAIWIDHDLSKKIGHIGSFVFEATAADAYMAGKQDTPNAEVGA